MKPSQNWLPAEPHSVHNVSKPHSPFGHKAVIIFLPPNNSSLIFSQTFTPVLPNFQTNILKGADPTLPCTPDEKGCACSRERLFLKLWTLHTIKHPKISLADCLFRSYSSRKENSFWRSAAWPHWCLQHWLLQQPLRGCFQHLTSVSGGSLHKRQDTVTACKNWH